MNLQFVNVTDPNEIKTGDTRKLVRSHAMRHFRHRQRLDNRSGEASVAVQTLLGSKSRRKQSRLAHKSPQCRLVDADEDEDEDEDEDDDIISGDSSSAALVRAAMASQLDLFPMSLPEKYIYKVFDHCKEPLVLPSRS
jgi:hypothetical protein